MTENQSNQDGGSVSRTNTDNSRGPSVQFKNTSVKNPASSDTINVPQFTAFIVGDSIKRRLSPTKMTDQSVLVKIGSKSGRKVDTVVKTVTDMSETDAAYVRDLHTVLKQAGTNDISDCDNPRNVAHKTEMAITDINKSVCP